MDKGNSNFHKKTADTILENLEVYYHSPEGENFGFLLSQSTGHAPHGYERAAPIIYADYYYLEALLRKSSIERARN